MDHLESEIYMVVGGVRCVKIREVSSFQRWYVQASMELGAEDVSLLERCPHFRGWYVQASMELGPEDVSLLEGVLISDIKDLL